jgi:hypothetical protein
MAENQWVHVIHPDTLQRAAVKRERFDTVLSDAGWVIDPEAGDDVPAQTVKASERKLDKAEVKRTNATNEDGA